MNILESYLYYMVLFMTILFVGELFFALLHIKVSENKFIHVFEKLVIGLIISVALFAIYKTSGKTILIAALIPLLFMERQVVSINWRLNLSINLKALIFISMMYVPLGLYYFIMNKNVFIQTSFEADALFYKNIAQMMSATGVEGYLEIQNGNSDFILRTPYHYFDLWLIAFYDLPGLMTTWQVMMPAMCAIAMFGIFAYAKSIGAKNTKAIFLMGWIVIAPIGFLYSIHFESRPARSLKYITIFLIFLLFSIKYIKDKKVNYFILFSIPALSVLTAPGIFGGFLLHRFFEFAFKNKMKNYRIPLKEFVVFFFVISIFAITYVGQSTGAVNGLGTFVAEYYSSFEYNSLIKISGGFYSFSYFTAISLLPYFIFFIFEKNNFIKNAVQSNLEIFVFLIFLCVSAMFLGGVLWFDPNAYQFYYLFFPLLCSLLLLPIINSTVNGRFSRLNTLLSLVFMICLAALAHIKLSNETFYVNEVQAERDEIEFRKSIVNVLDQSIGKEVDQSVKIFAIRDLSHFRNDIYDYYVSVYTPLAFLHFYKNNIKIIQLHAHDLLKYETKIYHPADEKYTLKYHIQNMKLGDKSGFNDSLFKAKILMSMSSHSFFLFLNQFSNSVDINTVREQYIKDNDMRFGFADDCSLFPEGIFKKASSVIVHRKSGACFIKI